MESKPISRRSLLQGAASIGALGAMGSRIALGQDDPAAVKPTLKQGAVILF